MALKTHEQLKAAVQELSNQIFEEIVAIRRDLHRHPELAFEETRTASVVSDFLQACGVPAQKGVAKTGVVGMLYGKAPDHDQRLLAFRADMDALPMSEENSHDFCSLTPNKMHACGHDAHTAMLLGTAKILSSLSDELAGDVQFIFQPSEEIAPGGAQAMIDDGIFKDRKPDVIYGQHCIPQIPVGQIGFVTGPMMAAADEIYITVKGKGGHASAPHRTSDPIIAACQMVMNLQTIISRNFPPYEPAVLTIGAINGGSATNVIPNEVKLMGTYRTMNEEVRILGHRRMQEIVEQTAKSFGVEAELEIRKGFPAVINDENATEFAFRASQEYMGTSATLHAEPFMAAEDFSNFLKHVPGSFWQLGVSNPEKGIVHNIHSSKFDLDEQAILHGIGYMSYLALTYFRHSQNGSM
jgi:amidohydrolase/hippurate hydrolase